MARAEPTIVASSPMARCRKPPTFALAYISPARSSKRRMSIIVCSHSRATSGSGRGWSAIVRRTLAQGRRLSRPGERRHRRPFGLVDVRRLGVHDERPADGAQLAGDVLLQPRELDEVAVGLL